MGEELVVPTSGRTQPPDHVISEIAARQHGLVTRAQLLGVGVAPDVVRWRVRTKRIEPMQRGVYRVGPLVAPRAKEMAAVLACGQGAVLSHWSAAVLCRLCAERGNAGLVDVTVPAGERRCRPGIRVHRVLALRPEEVMEVDGIPVTTLSRTIIDLSSEASSAEMRQVLALAAREHGMTRAELSDLIARYRRRRGVPLLRALAEDDTPPALTRSEAEARLLRLIRRAQLPHPEVNARIENYEVDFLWRAQRMVVEVDGFAFHSSRERFESDRRRDAILAARGYRVVRVTCRHMEREPEALLVRLAQALATVVQPGTISNGAR